jgi:hypothetical protein
VSGEDFRLSVLQESDRHCLGLLNKKLCVVLFDVFAVRLLLWTAKEEEVVDL